MTALAGVQHEQSTLQNNEKWNTTNSKKFIVLKNFWVSDESNYIQIIRDSSPLMVLKLFFFLVRALRPPQRQKCRGDIFPRKNIYTFLLKVKIIKTQVFDVETEGACLINCY